MRVKKDGPAARDIPLIFTDQCIGKLVAETGLPLDPDRLPGFAASVRTRARIYLRDKGLPSDADVAREIAELYWAADRHQHAKAAKLVRSMSKRTRVFLNKRATMPSVDLTIPNPAPSSIPPDGMQRARHCGGYPLNIHKRLNKSKDCPD
jgi:hypothetical protein